MIQTSTANARVVVSELGTEAAAWDDFVHRTPGSTIAHLAGWRDVIRGSFGHEAHYLVARTGEAVVGILPLFRLRSHLFGPRVVSVPFLNDGGPLGSPEAIDALVARAVVLARREPLELRTRVRRPSDRLHPDDRKVTVLLPLNPTAEAHWTALPSKVRSQVRRPMKAGLTVRFGSELLDDYFAVWSHNMRDLGTPVLPRRFFHELARAFGDRLVVGCVYRDAVPIAAGAGFLFGEEFEITWASALRDHNRDSPNMLLYWAFMERAIELGATTFNFGRCTPGEGTHRFKLQWGGESVPLEWSTSRAQSDSTGAPGRSARLLSSAWQRLPLSVANTLGPIVARQLPWW